MSVQLAFYFYELLIITNSMNYQNDQRESFDATWKYDALTAL